MTTARDPVYAALKPGERIVWRQPAPAERLARSNFVPIVFLIVWCGFIGFVCADFTRNAVSAVRTYGFDLMNVIFMAAAAILAFITLFGLRALWSHIVAMKESRDTHYALTNARLIIASPSCVFEYRPADVARLEVDGGDILFDWGMSGGRYRRERFRAWLLDVTDAARIAALITRTLATAKPI